MREGVDDYRYIYTLQHWILEAKRANLASTLIDKAESLISEVQKSVHLANYRKRVEAASQLGKRTGGIFDAVYFDRKPPEPNLLPERYDQLRYQISQQITELEVAIP